MPDNVSLHLELASAETLLDSAAQLVLDASSIMRDVGDGETLQSLEALSVTIAREVEHLRRKRLGIEAGA